MDITHGEYARTEKMEINILQQFFTLNQSSPPLRIFANKEGFLFPCQPEINLNNYYGMSEVIQSNWSVGIDDQGHRGL